MSERPRIPLPEESDYVDAIKHAIEADQITAKDGLERAIKRESFQNRHITIGMANARHWGKLVEPFDRTSRGYVHDGLPVSEAVQLGTGFGLLMFPHVHKQFITIEDAIAGIPSVNQPDTNDIPQARHELASMVVELGEEGISFMGEEANDQLMDIEMKVIHDVKHQRMFRVGCGIVALGGFIAHDKRLRLLDERSAAQNRQSIEKSLESPDDIDWNAALAGLLENNA